VCEQVLLYSQTFTLYEDVIEMFQVGKFPPSLPPSLLSNSPALSSPYVLDRGSWGLFFSTSCVFPGKLLPLSVQTQD
jgi:hypothetical protein